MVQTLGEVCNNLIRLNRLGTQTTQHILEKFFQLNNFCPNNMVGTICQHKTGMSKTDYEKLILVKKDCEDAWIGYLNFLSQNGKYQDL